MMMFNILTHDADNPLDMVVKMILMISVDDQLDVVDTDGQNTDDQHG